EAAAYLLEATKGRRLMRPTDPADAAELARELDGLALALEQAAAYIVQQRIGLADYLKAWRSHAAAVQEWHDPQVMQYPRSIAVTWETTLQQLRPGDLALLRLLAWMAPDPVPMWVLEGEESEAIWREAIGF